MDKGLVDKVVELTGKQEETVADFLATLGLDQLYTLIDSHRKGDDATMHTVLGPLMAQEEPLSAEEPSTEVEEAMTKKDTKITMAVPKPRDPMARELEKGQYQPKVTPNKKERLAKMDRKHKGREPFESVGEPLAEGVMGMTALPAIKKMLSLAGRPEPSDEEVQAAMEDFMGDMHPDLRGLSISDIATPVGTSITPGAVEFDQEVDNMGKPVDGADYTGEAYSAIRSSFETIKTSLADVTITEFMEVRRLVAELQSLIDQLANGTK